MSDMIEIYKKYSVPILAIKEVDDGKIPFLGIVDVNKCKNNVYKIIEMVEKPHLDKAPSNLAIIGRYVLPASIFRKLAKQTKNQGGEIHITDSIQSLIKDNHKFIGHNFAGKYLDCGTMHGYIKSTVDISKL